MAAMIRPQAAGKTKHEEMLRKEWNKLTERQKRRVIKKLFDPDDNKSELYLRNKRKYFVDEILTTNTKVMTLWGTEEKHKSLWLAFGKKVSMDRIRKWSTARQYLKDVSNQLVLNL